MPRTRQSAFRLPDPVLERIDALRRIWGPVASLSRSEVIAEAVTRCHKAEQTTAMQVRKTKP